MSKSALQVTLDLEAQRPELVPWLRPLRCALAALAEEPWHSLVAICADTRASGVPLLHEAIVPIEAAAVRAHVHAVLSAALDAAPRMDAASAAALLEGAIAHDDEAIRQVADEAKVNADALGAAAQLAALPLLQACTHHNAPSSARNWGDGYCHVCGAWPTIAEVLGLERARQLRCGRCGAAWRTEVLLCPFCGERDHAKLGSLVPEGAEGQVWWVETCATCRGYVKTHAALRGARAETVLLEDARSVELDMIAVERGFARPEGCGFSVRVRLSNVPVAVS